LNLLLLLLLRLAGRLLLPLLLQRTLLRLPACLPAAAALAAAPRLCNGRVSGPAAAGSKTLLTHGCPVEQADTAKLLTAGMAYACMHAAYSTTQVGATANPYMLPHKLQLMQ
jgi:hypothetical protein